MGQVNNLGLLIAQLGVLEDTRAQLHTILDFFHITKNNTIVDMVLDDIFDHFLHLRVKWQQSGLNVGLVREGYIVPGTGRYVI